MVTGGTEASFTGVYKLAARSDGKGGMIPTMKLSDNPDKTTNPGIKQVWRLYHDDGSAKADVLALDGERVEPGKATIYFHPANDYQSFSFSAAAARPLLTVKMRDGARVAREEPLPAIKSRVQGGLEELDRTYRRILNPHVYKVSLTEGLRGLKQELLRGYVGRP
jgi:nicotinate phosphoribosyltransferase